MTYEKDTTNKTLGFLKEIITIKNKPKIVIVCIGYPAVMNVECIQELFTQAIIKLNRKVNDLEWRLGD